MPRTRTDSFILELKLKTSLADAAYLEKCFSAGHSIYNILVRHCRGRIASLRQELAEYRIQKDGNVRKAVSEQLKALVAAYGLTEYSLHSFVKVQQKKHKKYINSLVAQKIASSVWKGVEKVLYGNGKLLRFRKYTEFVSLEGKNNSTGFIPKIYGVCFPGRKEQQHRVYFPGRHFKSERATHLCVTSQERRVRLPLI